MHQRYGYGLTKEAILNMSYREFYTRVNDLFMIHAHFNSEKGKGRVVKETLQEQQAKAKLFGVKPPKKEKS